MIVMLGFFVGFLLVVFVASSIVLHHRRKLNSESSESVNVEGILAAPTQAVYPNQVFDDPIDDPKLSKECPR